MIVTDTVQTTLTRAAPDAGLWLPLITPFHDGALDAVSLRRLLRHYLAQPLDGIILAGTTGEAMTLDEVELSNLVRVTAEEVAGCGPPFFVGVGGKKTRARSRSACRRAISARRRPVGRPLH